MMTEVSIDADQLRLYAEASRKAGTQDKFIDLALEWADKAQAYVEQLHEQHQWHRVENELPPSTELVVILYRPENNTQRVVIAAEVRSLIFVAKHRTYTHWRYSTPPTEDK